MTDKILNFFQNQSAKKSKLPLILSLLVLLFIVGYTVINFDFSYALGDNRTIYTCPDCGYESYTSSAVYSQSRGVYKCKHCDFTTYDVHDFYAVENQKTGKVTTWDEANKNNKGILGILKEIGKFIFSALLAAIGSILYGVSSAAYGFLGENDFIGNFIKFSLDFASISSSASSIAGSALSLLSNLAFSLVVLFVLRNILLNYILWRGNPNENPLETIIGIAMCVAMIAGFSEIYAGISSILGNLVTSISGGNTNFSDIPKNMLNSVGVSVSNNSFDVMKAFFEDPTGLGKFAKMTVVLIISLILFVKLLQALISAAKAGLELLALKVAAPMFCLSLLNNNIGGFGSYLKEICKRFFGIMLRVAAINIALGFLSNASGSIIFTVCGAFACIAVVENAGQFLSGIVSSVGGGNEVNSAIRGTSAVGNMAFRSFSSLMRRN